ncbi:4'-phosphopantetheinyl transferase family protein [Streptomyces calidiresistens]|uniref:4'-phosphopantetheinyl transferase superfamily protein n=1 Tax=Streptomyces calidiresistens TaxID=1485586 RepID=A0A7W3T7X7_9ACTN|nr:4'-phosphopantetheinyl transferase superfamily protein [Streptomyces calidiresistens]MBB0232620.1 4'-phosphopantetheinyl transferase superfamily protein [Streptomyces calidiresistens]
MLKELLPADVESAELFGEASEEDLPPLFPEEEAVVARAVAKRRREFAGVRACAREALGRLGVPPAPLLPGERGAPGWPEGIVGSMTHCAGYRGAAVTRRGRWAALGVDAEPHEPLRDPGVTNLVTVPVERERVLPALADRHPSVHWERLLFSAKESVYKAWFPLTGRWLGFEEAELALRPDPDGPGSGAFRARLLVPGPVVAGREIPGFDGRWLVRGGLVLTTVTVPGSPAGADTGGR